VGKISLLRCRKSAINGSLKSLFCQRVREMTRVRHWLVLVLTCGLTAPAASASGVTRPIPAGDATNKGVMLVHARTDRKTPPPQPAKPPKGAKSAPATVPPPVERLRLQRSVAARQAFERQSGYANGRPGYIVEYIVPLSCGGTDTPRNMEWLTLAEARAKNRLQRSSCR
jgi:hypothetical protein